MRGRKSAAIQPSADDLHLKVEYRDVKSLKPYAGNARTHSKKQISQIAASIRTFGFNNPVLIDDQDQIVAGHGRWCAAQQLGRSQVPTIRLSHLSEPERRAYVIADNRLAELSGWDDDILKIELQALAAVNVDFELEVTGFETTKLDLLLDGPVNPKPSPKDDQIFEPAPGPGITRLGDVWLMGEHRLVCGDATRPDTYVPLMQGELARMVFTDPPYNVPIAGHVGGSGKTKHREFVMASGEMTSDAFADFLTRTFASLKANSHDGSIHFHCMDWRHIPEIKAAGDAVYDELKNLLVWVKDRGGMGAFYRSRHELVFAFKAGAGAHVNTFGLGETGRYRTNVLEYPGVNTFRVDEGDELAMHPTVKPVAMVADLIRDVSRRREVVLDAFGGSGTTLIAAEKVGRRARLVELDPLYCDVICRRWQAYSGTPAIREDTGQSFDDLAAEARPQVEAA